MAHMSYGKSNFMCAFLRMREVFMTNKEKKRRMAQEVLMILGMLALFLFICRLWPILFLVILGIFIAAIRMLFLSTKEVEVLTIPPEEEKPVREPTEYDVRHLAYSVILRRITELVTGRYPQARWLWESPDAMQLMEMGQDVFILLNNAGGYRRAKVMIQNLQVVGFEFMKLSLPGPVPEEPKEDEDPEGEEVPEDEDSDDSEEPQPENYGLLAFEWVDAHILELNERYNEAIGKGLKEVLLSAEELPVPESWQDICLELQRLDLKEVECTTDGIKIMLTQQR